MANINSKYRVSNGKDYGNIYHFETNGGQVLMSGNRTLSEVLEGKRVSNQNLTSLKSDGKYLVTNSVGLPTGLNASLTYLLKVETVDSVVWQTLYDHIGNNIYTRCMTQLGFSAWSNGGKDIQDKVFGLQDKVSNLEFDVKANTDNIAEHEVKISNILDEMGQEITAHNHDERYVSKTGGIYTGSFGMNNEVSLVANTTSGASRNVAKINSSNVMIIGDSSTPLSIQSSSDLTINGQKVIHEGNISEITGGSGGDVYQNKRNIFSDVQTIKSGGLKLIGSTSELKFEKEDGSSVGSIVQDSSDLVMKLRNSEVFRLRSSDNALMANQKLILQGDGKVWLRMGVNSSDVGCGFTATGSKDFTMYDWAKNKIIYSVNRNENVVEFTNSIRIGGRKLSVSGTAPSNPSVGDIWLG